MALNVETQYPGKIAAGNAARPYGNARNITTTSDGTGTPWEAALINDLFGWQQALLAIMQVPPSGSPDEVGASQYVQAMLEAASGRAYTYDETGAANAYILGVRTGMQPLSALYDGLVVKFRPTNTSNAGASTLDVSALLGEAPATTLRNLAISTREAVGGGHLLAGEMVTATYHLATTTFVVSNPSADRSIVNLQSGNYTFLPSDYSKTVFKDAGAAAQYTIDTFANQPVKVGSIIRGVNVTSAVLTVAPAGGVNLYWLDGTDAAIASASRTVGRRGDFSLWHQSTNNWYISGNRAVL